MSDNIFIDNRNTDLWILLNEHYDIEIKASLNQEYGCYTEHNQAIIYVPYGGTSIDSFTHELLHIYLKHKEFYLGNSIIRLIGQSNILSSVLSMALLEHIGNCLDHLKMFQIYKERGLDERLFLLDFDEHKCTPSELLLLKGNFRIGKAINPKAVDYYIGKLVAMLCDPNALHDYLNPIAEFKKMDAELFRIVDQLVIETKEYDIDNDDIFVSYRDISQKFYSELGSWFSKRGIR